ncbi:MAG: hypothetical protein Q8897_00910 [Sweet potato little leaf phytoplasma]|uniref:Uncharacterized protein n=2 Tax=Candidatus Phytoplasma TaxID=33926 RepID=A0ABP2TG74_PEWBP|nr:MULTISPECIES: hypothetical protein [Phytoplasma]MDV3139215.1 hypothetical protein [Candidatus Phytoplasma australasiaticum]QLL36717.1 hypothetical protein EPWB_v2c0820 ['Echinacea purpurea' witches'-broom phytoplasma]EMR14646.1 hypothetical protein PNWB_v1c2460 [Peanut witches'-broom phytoplasma NTU2011]MDO7986962.1 hypothetical protein [Sweet potato little leaf phytoplasma]MDO8005344.1 hypothetical protein [Sweet potato little leaf phytoplasma]
MIRINNKKKADSLKKKKYCNDQTKISLKTNKDKKNLLYKFKKISNLTKIMSFLIILIIFVTIVGIPIGYFIYLSLQK